MAIGLAIVAGAVTLLGRGSGLESDRSAVTTPELPTTLVTIAGTPLPIHDELEVSLDTEVPGFTGTLVLTMGTPDGTEVWRWSSGSNGRLDRSQPVSDIYDARPDASGSWVMGILRFGRQEPQLQAALDSHPVPIFWGADSFSWHAGQPGRIGWLEPQAGSAALHIGAHISEGVWFKPSSTIPTSEGESLRLVGLDDIGFVIQVTSSDREFAVERVDQEGTITGRVSGVFAGLSPGGQVAVTNETTTVLHRGPDLSAGATIELPVSSAVWNADGSRLAVTHYEAETVDIIQGAARTTVAVGPIQPSILTWDAAGRFVVLSGHLDAGDPVLVFVDTDTLEIRSVVVTAHPIAAVVAH